MPATSTGTSAFGNSAPRERSSRRTHIAIWTVQLLLACLFLFAGGAKLVMPIAQMTKQFPLPGLFLRFLGVVEIAGALGLVLPSLLRIRPYLTPIAAGGLVIVMSGATAISMAGGSVTPAIPPFVIGCLAGLVLYARTRVVPIREKAHGSARHGVGGASWLRRTA
ncbi:MAG: DoxX family protein [Gemmatimonadota bacterium]